MRNEISDWKRFVNGCFSPWGGVEVSDRLLGSLLIAISQLILLFIGWCAKGFSLTGLIKSDDPFVHLMILILTSATIFFVVYLVFRIIKGSLDFLIYKILSREEYEEWEGEEWRRKVEGIGNRS